MGVLTDWSNVKSVKIPGYMHYIGTYMGQF